MVCVSRLGPCISLCDVGVECVPCEPSGERVHGPSDVASSVPLDVAASETGVSSMSPGGRLVAEWCSCVESVVSGACGVSVAVLMLCVVRSPVGTEDGSASDYLALP